MKVEAAYLLNNGKILVADAQKKTEANAARLCSINAMTGLEAPIVFILGATDLLLIEQSLRLAPEERKELIRDNTRKLFTAMTRASALSCVQTKPPAVRYSVFSFHIS